MYPAVAFAAEWPADPLQSGDVYALDPLGIGWGLAPLVMEPRPDHVIWAWPVVKDPLDAVPEPRPRLRAALGMPTAPSRLALRRRAPGRSAPR